MPGHQADEALNKVAHNLELDERSITALKSTGLSQSGMLGVAYLSKVSGKPISELVVMRERDGSWSTVSHRLGFPMDFMDDK